ncbi:Hypothetical protein PP7435_CHR1-1365 [Komagataella phaffii CBS 7435]|uniref:Uncharacterized protein n=1 Tax=Komagataella phaffii (strain ATCC 76273 / CBS 7435 / CECT 11047 / NRRL Y-11430 / Wegner 21-1) TaxID=981350 RepID=F2QQ05_KOMPC|nr:GQ67_01583T0 [Komagataella phaffii]AOA66087.1 GQ68_01599T0 [Komagataella phaffii GS115]CAH2447244.1 Hypothetical protein BQ9382_C1-7145 [Komagataella phaffii CBS 7435]CCA37483.1 Hypothetical protein PP7435_CHR1-1365 [Komagataella phaffii CBS 7435]
MGPPKTRRKSNGSGIDKKPNVALVRESFECAKKVLELDSDEVIKKMSTVEKSNISLIVDYNKVYEKLQDVESSANNLKELNSQIELLNKNLLAAENSVTNLEELIQEVNGWSLAIEKAVDERV